MKAQKEKKSVSTTSAKSDDMKKLLEQYGCGPVQFTGTNDALYERHLSLTTLWKQRRSARASVLRPSPAPCAIFFRSDGCVPKRPMSARTPSAFTICRWNFSSAARWLTMSRTFSSIPSRKKSSSKRTSIGSSCSSRNPTRVWAMEVSGAWRLASSIPWPRCKFQRWATACATNTASSSRRFRTGGNTKSRTTGSVAPTHGKLRARTRRWT